MFLKRIAMLCNPILRSILSCLAFVAVCLTCLFACQERFFLYMGLAKARILFTSILPVIRLIFAFLCHLLNLIDHQKALIDLILALKHFGELFSLDLTKILLCSVTAIC